MDWLQRLRDYGSRVYNDYASARQQAGGIGNELAAKAQMMDQARLALGQQPVARGTEQAPAPSEPATLAPYEHVRQGYKPIGGANALRMTLQGKPPDLR